MEAHLGRSCRSAFYLCEIWGAQRGVRKRECWGGRLGCALLCLFVCLFVCVGLRGFCMIIFYSDECRRNVLQLLDKTWGKDKRRVTGRSVGVGWNVLTHWVKNVLTFCALDRVKMLSALKWGRFGFELPEEKLLCLYGFSRLWDEQLCGRLVRCLLKETQKHISMEKTRWEAESCFWYSNIVKMLFYRTVSTYRVKEKVKSLCKPRRRMAE
jgi:hypothetical protein